MNFVWPQEPLSSNNTKKALRQVILESITAAKSGHPGGSLSMVEILCAIFDGNFFRGERGFSDPESDRFVLSKGHGVPALYAVLSYLREFAPGELLKLRSAGHFLQGHPDRSKYPLMEASTGSLGQGASVALGIALGLRLSYQQKKISRLPRVYCVLGDGESQEGQVWECLMACGKFLPGNLMFILDYNKGQIDGPVKEVMDLEPLEDKIRSFNLEMNRVDGHSVDALKKIISSWDPSESGKAKFVIADTVKGKGISFVEHPNKWHGAALNSEQLKGALDELWVNKRPFGQLLTQV